METAGREAKEDGIVEAKLAELVFPFVADVEVPFSEVRVFEVKLDAVVVNPVLVLEFTLPNQSEVLQ